MFYFLPSIRNGRSLELRISSSFFLGGSNCKHCFIYYGSKTLKVVENISDAKLARRLKIHKRMWFIRRSFGINWMCFGLASWSRLNLYNKCNWYKNVYSKATKWPNIFSKLIFLKWRKILSLIISIRLENIFIHLFT